MIGAAERGFDHGPEHGPGEIDGDPLLREDLQTGQDAPVEDAARHVAADPRVTPGQTPHLEGEQCEGFAADGGGLLGPNGL